MRSDNWKIYDKKGSNINPYTDAFLTIDFITPVTSARGAEAYAITDPSGIITDVAVTNSGYGYIESQTTSMLSYAFTDYEEILTPIEASIYYIDVSIFNPLPVNSSGIGSMVIDVSTEFIYPSIMYASAAFMDPVSVELIETEHLSILEESSTGVMIRPFDADNSTLVFKFSDGDESIKLFEIDAETQTLIWAEELVFDISEYVPGTPLIINIGFKSEEEGVYERKLRAYHRIAGEDYLAAEVLVNSQSIGPDGRFDVLAQDFGLPNPKNIPHLFKEADINEEMPDWELLNYKGKHIVLEHDKIMPYIGTYKALINAIKWLGYEDIKIKEWFKDVKASKKLSLYVPYEAADRTKTILYFSPEERRNLKKLNELSLVYCITRETGEIDEYGNPLVEECYEYNVNEILIKLRALKEWLEKNIIGVNARITDVTGEGVYFERFRSFIYATQDQGSRAEYSQSLTPVTIDEDSELSMGEADIGLTLREITETEIGDFEGIRIKDLLQYYWDPSNGAFDPADASALWWDPSTVYFGAPFKFPFLDLYDVQYKASVEKTDSGVLTEKYVTNPLFVYENTLRFYNILDSSSVFYDSSTGLRVFIEEGFLRDASNDNWPDSIAYSIYGDPSDLSKYFVESSTGILWETDGWVSLRPDASSHLQYAFDDNYKVPLLSMKNFVFTDSSANTVSFDQDKDYYLDILDGKIKMNAYQGPEIAIRGLLDFDGINDSVRFTIEPDVTGNKSVSFSAYFDPSTSTSIYWIFAGGAPNNNDYLEIAYRANLKRLLVAGKRVSGRKDYDISDYMNQPVLIEIEKETGNITSVKANGNELSAVSTGNGQYSNNPTYIGYSGGPGTWVHLDQAYIWDFKIEGQNFWAGRPNGNTNPAWADTIGLSNGVVLGSPTTIDISILNPNYGAEEVNYINWNYDTSLAEQKITLNVVYSSPKAPLYLYDPSAYYAAKVDSSNNDIEDSLVLDNSIYIMNVNHIGPYQIEVFGWDGQNNVYRNFIREEYEVWTKYPIIWSYIDTSCGYGADVTLCPSALLSPLDISALSEANLYPIFDRQVPLQGLTLEQDIDDNYYINVPSISYFVDLPDNGSIARFYNMTERVTERVGDVFTVDPDFQSFNNGDDVNLVLFDRGQYYFIDEVSGNISSVTLNDLTIIGIDSKFVTDSSTEVYLLNDTRREIFREINDLANQTVEIDISAYQFEVNQLVGIIIDDVCTGYAWGSSFRVLDSSTDGSIGNYHKLKGNIPEFILDDPSRYEITAKHAYSTFADFEIDIETAIEDDNNFNIYLDDYYYHQYYLDNTFVYVNILFDQEAVLDQWYNHTEPDPIELLTDWDNHGFTGFISDGTTITIATNTGDPSAYCQSNTFSVLPGGTIDISINYYNGGGLPRPPIPKFYIQELGGDDPSTEYTIVKNQGSWYQNNFIHTLDSSTTSAYLRFIDGSIGTVDMNFSAQTSVTGADSTDPYYSPKTFYPYAKAITIDPETLVILDAFYDPSNYMLNQKNIWTLREHDSQDLIFRVYNKSVPYIFADPGIYDVQVEAYDSFGNLKSQSFEGLITVSNV